MGLKGGKKTTTTTEQQIPAWITQAAQGNLALANTLTEPFVQQAPDYMVAPFNGDQLASFDISRNFANAQSQVDRNDLGYSYFRGFADRPAYTVANVGGIPQMQAASIMSTQPLQAAQIAPVSNVAAQRFTDADLQAYMNPYAQSVVDSSLTDLRDEYGRSQTASNLQQASSGAFGGARHGIREAQVTDDYLRNVGRTTSNLRNQAFNAAAGLIQTDQNRALQAAQANQQAQMQRAMQQAQLEQEANRYAAELDRQKSFTEGQWQQDANTRNADLEMRGRLADIDSRYRSDQQRLGAVRDMANSTLTAQQLADQRTLQNAELLGSIGLQQQQYDQAVADAPFRALDIRNATLRGTPYPTTTTQTTQSPGGGKGGLLSTIGGSIFNPVGAALGTAVGKAFST